MPENKPGPPRAPLGSGPLGLSGVRPSGTVEENYLNEFVEPHRPPSPPPNWVPATPPREPLKEPR